MWIFIYWMILCSDHLLRIESQLLSSPNAWWQLVSFLLPFPFSPGKEWKNIFIVYSLFSLSHPSPPFLPRAHLQQSVKMWIIPIISHIHRAYRIEDDDDDASRKKNRRDGAGSTKKNNYSKPRPRRRNLWCGIEEGGKEWKKSENLTISCDIKISNKIPFGWSAATRVRDFGIVKQISRRNHAMQLVERINANEGGKTSRFWFQVDIVIWMWGIFLLLFMWLVYVRAWFIFILLFIQRWLQLNLN